MSSNLLKSLKALCCCASSNDDDDDNLIENEQEYDWSQSNNINRHSTNGIANHTLASSSRGADGALIQTQSARTQSEAEEDALNKILDRTQQSIIDVGNLDNINALDIDAAQRSRLYSEAVKRHDAQFERKNNSAGASSSINDQNLAYVNTNVSLLVDIGFKAGEVLSEPVESKLDANEFALLCRTSDLLYESVLIGSRVELREELIAYMSQDN